MYLIVARFLLLCALISAAWPAVAQQRIQKVSGDGQLALPFYSPTQPLVVKVVDGAGNPVAGKSVKWTDVGGIIHASPSTVTTDATGLASFQFVAGGSFSPGVGYLSYTVTATTDIGSVSFSIVSYPFQTGPANYQPLVDFLKPLQGVPITLRAGERVADAIRVNVATSGANGGSAGLPIPAVGLTVRSANQDPLAGPVASCTGGTLLTGSDGIASCELLASGTPGSTDLIVNVGDSRSLTVHLTMLPGDPTPAITQGDNQSGLPTQILPIPLQARITDSLNNPLAGRAVQWSVVTPGSATLLNSVSTSDAAGNVSTSVQLGTTPGSYQIQLAVGSNSILFNIVIQGTVPALTISMASVPNGVVGGAYSPTLAGTGGSVVYTASLAPGATSPGLTVNLNGTIAGAPTAARSYGYTMRATDSQSAQASRTSTVVPSSGLAITTTALPTASVGAAYSLTLAAVGGTPPYKWDLYSGSIVASVLPPGLALSAAGVISGTPTTSGTYGLTIRVVDSASHEAYQSYSFAVAVGLVVSSTTLPNGSVGVVYAQTLTAAGGTLPYTWTLASGTLTPGLTLSAAGNLSGVPTAVGTSTFSVRVTDAAGGSATANYVITIGTALQISSASTLPNGTLGAIYSAQFTVAGGTAPFIWALNSGALPPGLMLSTSGLLTGQPTSAGNFFFSVRVSDSTGLFTAASITLTVGSAGSLPRTGVISQVASGGGWKTSVNLLNVNAVAAQVHVQFMAEDGTALDLPLTITQQGTSVTQAGGAVEATLAPNATLLIETEAPISTTTVGWADVQSSATLAGYAIFRQHGGDGHDSEGTSPLEASGKGVVLLTYDSSIGFSTGVALVNVATTQANITAIQRDDAGNELARDTIQLPGNGHTSFSMLDRYPALAGRRGVVEFQSDQTAGITVLGLRFSPTLSFTSIPVAFRP
ncbi:putative Ig domain-containing protein [uncultured Paludibaculum sp.]|uniref:beta strand repeat-containing protein n=1 Tax=uncultured Paludibaculum sp. TaxID=1765020 RepID=UPI002AABE322|nr:putative Ig domain-containing protein [uncultured Paludibaculum sp.]